MPVSSPRLVLMVCAPLALGGCVDTRPTQRAFEPDDYRDRHPLQIEQAAKHIDIFGASPQLDHRQRRDLVEFARAHSRRGSGSIKITTPSGSPHVSIEAIRAALIEGGLRGPVRYSQYPANAGAGAAPVRVSHALLSASVASKCGQWPKDLSGNEGLESWHNKPYHNLGCAYQTMIAAQVDDPVDLVRPRAEGAYDLEKRMKDIEAIRKDQDPATKWASDDVKVGGK